jgi:ligand-binding sensor domain-containing protein
VAARIPARLKDEGITSFLIDRQGGIWYGSSDLWRLNSADGSLRHFPLEARANSPMRSVLAMIEDHAGRIWAGTSLDLVRLDGDSGKAIYFRHDPHDPASIGPGYVRAVLEGRTGELWIGTGEGGVQRLDASGRVITRFVRDPNRPDSLSDNYVTALYEDSEGTLWVGTRSGGLNALDTASGRITRYLPDPGDPHSLSHHCVTSLLGDRHGRLWVATAGGGLNRVEKGSLQFQRTLESDGLVDNDVMAILEDDDGSLWLSTRRGIARFDPTTSKFLSIQASDGLPSAEFETGSAAKLTDPLFRKREGAGRRAGRNRVPTASSISDDRDLNPDACGGGAGKPPGVGHGSPRAALRGVAFSRAGGAGLFPRAPAPIRVSTEGKMGRSGSERGDHFHGARAGSPSLRRSGKEQRRGVEPAHG